MKTFVTSKLILLFMVLQLLCSFKRFGAMITFDVGYFFKAIHLGNAKVNLVKTLFVLFIRAENIKWWMSSLVEVGSSIYIWDMMEVGTSSTYSWDMGQLGMPTSSHSWDMAWWLDWLLWRGCLNSYFFSCRNRLYSCFYKSGPIFNSLYSCISKLDSFYSYFLSRSSISSCFCTCLSTPCPTTEARRTGSWWWWLMYFLWGVKSKLKVKTHCGFTTVAVCSQASTFVMFPQV